VPNQPLQPTAAHYDSFVLPGRCRAAAA